MTELYSQYSSGTQFTAGAIVGSALGVSGVNAIVDRLNSVVPSNNLISGTDVVIIGSSISGFPKTSYWSCAGVNFKGRSPDIDDIRYTTSNNFSYMVQITTGPVTLLAPVSLPDGVVVTAAVVNGNISDETWTLVRAPIDGSAETAMATANTNTEDSSITNATIDNSTYSYIIQTSTLDSTDILYGARITYTTDFN